MSDPPKLLICTPLYGSGESARVSLGYHVAITKLGEGIGRLPPRHFIGTDLVRARSRALRTFVQSGAENLLFWDEDVIPRDLNVINAMRHSGKDVIALPYPRKRLRWDVLADAVRNEDEQSEMGRQSPEELEAAATDWSIQYDGEARIGPDGLARVKFAPCGFMMISRSCALRMTDAYAPALTFRDHCDGHTGDVVATFMLTIRDGVLLSEDYSFCQRWRDIGGDVWVLCDPADHVGAHRFRGHWQGLVQQ